MDPTPLRDFVMSDPNVVPSNIVKPQIEANNFQFNPEVIILFLTRAIQRVPLEELQYAYRVLFGEV